mgnify:FL=1
MNWASPRRANRSKSRAPAKDEAAAASNAIPIASMKAMLAASLRASPGGPPSPAAAWAADPTLSRAADISSSWLNSTIRLRNASKKWREALRLESHVVDIPSFVSSARELCQEPSAVGPIWNAYGGHYFSPTQAISIDYMLKYLPSEEPARTICIAASIICASQCAAAPGHTAQPFQPTIGASPFSMEAWRKSPIDIARRVLPDLCLRHAKVVGEAKVQDATAAAATLNSSDLVIVDPPYSGVQYSRFYHVLETVAEGNVDSVSGVGRYPLLKNRPQSSFSNKGQSSKAPFTLLETLAETGATVIFTFPVGESSNGLSGNKIHLWYI